MALLIDGIWQRQAIPKQQITQSALSYGGIARLEHTLQLNSFTATPESGVRAWPIFGKRVQNLRWAYFS